jgi:biopolymer transport protein ExbD
MTPIPSPRSSRRARIEIIPLIDIIFFLLATFVMVSLSMVKNNGIPVNLPAASTATPQERMESASVTITAKNEVYFDKQLVDAAQLDTALQGFAAGNPDAKLIINGDAKAEFGAAIDVLDRARKLGITRIAIETQPKPAP